MLILWSGGCDSTLLLLRALKETKKDDRKIRTLAINHDQISSAPYEKKARKRLRKKLLERGFKFAHREMTIKTAKRGIALGKDDRGLTQPGIWLFAGVGHLEHDEDLAIAYVQHDDIWHYVELYKYAFNNLTTIAAKTGKLLFPMEWDEKKAIIAELKKERLFNDTWYCELPTKKGHRCGRCASCKKMKNIH